MSNTRAGPAGEERAFKGGVASKERRKGTVTGYVFATQPLVEVRLFRDHRNQGAYVDLIRQTPVLPIDVKTAEAEGDLPAIAYQRAVTACQRETTAAFAEIWEGNPPQDRHGAPDAYAPAAAAADTMRTTLEPV